MQKKNLGESGGKDMMRDIGRARQFSDSRKSRLVHSCFTVKCRKALRTEPFCEEKKKALRQYAARP